MENAYDSDALGIFQKKLTDLFTAKLAEAAQLKPKRSRTIKADDGTKVERTEPSRMAMRAIKPLPAKKNSKADRDAKEKLLKDANSYYDKDGLDE